MSESTHSGPMAPRRNALVEGSILSAGVLLLVVLWAMVNYLGWRHYERFDWTSSQIYSLTEKSERVLAQIDRDIDIVTVLRPESELKTQVDELVARYVAVNPERVRHRDLDAARNRLELEQMVQEYGLERDNVIVVASGDERRVIDEFDLVEYDLSNPMGPPTVQEFKGEQLITSAILALVESQKPKIVFTAGHGEVSIEPGRGMTSLSQARSLLGNDNFEIEEWRSLGESDVPAGTDLLVIAGPESGFLPPELDAFSRYLDGGGRMLVLADVTFEPGGTQQIADLGLGEWLASYGIVLHDDIVVDPGSQLPLFGAETIFTSSFGSHPIVETLAQSGTPVLMTLARSLASGAESGDAPADAAITELVRTSDQAWGETDLVNLDQVAAGPDDIQPPLALGLAVSFPGRTIEPALVDGASIDDAADDETTVDGTVPDASVSDSVEPPVSDDAEDVEPAEARLVVFGDADFATDGSLGNGGNALLLLNAFNWLVEREELIEIEGREPKQSRLEMTGGEYYSLLAIVMALMPGLAIVLGVWTWMRRRR